MNKQLEVDEKILEDVDDLLKPDSETFDYEKEGEVAADYIEEFLDIADVDGDLDIEIRNGRTYISINAPEDSNLNRLVGRNGKVLVAFQELTRLAVLRNLNARSRFILDIQGYRTKKVERLKDLAQEAVDTVNASDETFHMEPMSSYERKIVHDFVASAGLCSESEGNGLTRHVVVSKFLS